MGDEGIPFPDFFPEDWEDDSEELSDERSRPSDEHASEGPAGEPSPGERKEAYPGESLLRGTRPSEVLERISRGDPLNMAGRTMQRIKDRAILMDSARLCMRAMAYVAHGAPYYEGEPPLAPWIDEHIDTAIQDFLEEDAYEEATKQPLEQPRDHRYAFLAELLGIPQHKARKACIVFNSLPSKDRKTFWAVCIEGKSLHRYVAEGNGPPKKVKARIEKVFRALSFLEDDEGPPDFSLEGGLL